METATILGIDTKRLDNVCSRVKSALIIPGARGRARQFGSNEVEFLAVTLLVARDLAIPIRSAATLASRLLVSETGHVALGALCAVHFDVSRLRKVLQQAIADAVQDREPVRRGRPPGKKKWGASL